MGDRLVDPYEQQLLAVFESCDDDQKGSLDKNGLLILCEKLQLEEQGMELMDCLLKGTAVRVTFVEFRDGLLALLDRGQGGNEPHGIDDLCVTDELPEREISPKFVFGKKKYGRRTRPKPSDLDSTDSVDDSDSDVSVGTATGTSPNSAKLEPKGSKKRKTSAINPTPEASPLITDDDVHSPPSVTSDNRPTAMYSLVGSDAEVQCLRNAWQRLGVGSDGYLDKEEVELVCSHIGMENVAGEVVNEVFEALDVDRDNRISFEEFHLLFRTGGHTDRGESGSGQDGNPSRFDHHLDSSPGDRQSSLADRPTMTATDNDHNYVWGLDINGNGCVHADLIVEVWERYNVPEPRSLLHSLGFTEPQLKVVELLNAVESEISALQGDSGCQSPKSPCEVLMHASMCICVSQVRCLKATLDQVRRERDKLRYDIAEANDRACLLAQEVDEHHSRLEYSNKAHIKSLELKHAEQMKDLADQLSHERDLLVNQNYVLQNRGWALEEAESKSRAEAAALKEESTALYNENQSLVEQLAAVEGDYASARKELEVLDGLRQGIKEMELNNDTEKIVSLLEKLDDVQNENNQLRDRNDELTMKVEALTLELAAVSFKKAGPLYSQDGDKTMMEQECTADDLIVAGGATKRRGDPPLSMSACEESSEEESPRLEKVRRCCSSPLHNGAIGMQKVRTLTPSGSVVNLVLSPEDNTLDSLGEQSNSSSLHVDDLTPAELKLREQVAYLKEQLKSFQDKLAVEADSEKQWTANSSQEKTDLLNQGEEMTKELGETSNMKEQLEQYCRDLRTELDVVKIEIVKILTDRNACSKENGALKNQISDLETNLGNSDSDLLEKTKGIKQLGASDVIALTNHAAPSSEIQSNCDGDNFNIDESNPSVKKMSKIHNDFTPVLNEEFEEEVSDVIGELKKEFAEKERALVAILNSDFADKLSCVEDGHTREKIELLERCTNLENSIELLRQEYERCEDYWAGKLEEERVLYDKEQRVLDNKYKKILAELKDYDEFFHVDGNNSGRSRLSTIDESVSLENQVTALEAECEELRTQMVTDRLSMAKEYETLKEDYKEQQKEMLLCACQTVEHKQRQQSIPLQVPDVINSNGTCGSDVEGQLRVDPAELRSPLQSFPATDQEPEPSERTWPEGPESEIRVLSAREQLIAEVTDLQQRRDELAEALHNEQRNAYVQGRRSNRIGYREDIEMIQAMNLRWLENEQRGRHMQMALKQRQRHTDMLLQQTWIKHKKEISELEIILRTTQNNLQQQTLACKEQLDRLSRNDILVKDLYVENAYLVANVQRLEQRYQALAQITTDSISV